MSKLKVYGWTWMAGHGQEQRVAERTAKHHRQIRVIVAARSMAAAARAFDRDHSPRQLDMCETGNTIELSRALAKPGVVFIAPLDGHYKPEDYEELIKK